MITVPDLFTHVLTGFVLAMVLSWRFESVRPPFVAVAAIGAFLPDLSRAELVIPASVIENVFGIPWSWSVFHRAGGTLLVIGMLTVVVRRRHMPLVFAMLLLGASSHYALDFMLWKASGQSGALLWPFTGWRFTIDGFYRSSDRWPAVVAIAAATVVVIGDRWKRARDVS